MINKMILSIFFIGIIFTQDIYEGLFLFSPTAGGGGAASTNLFFTCGMTTLNWTSFFFIFLIDVFFDIPIKYF